jgi:hypothetical protein
VRLATAAMVMATLAVLVIAVPRWTAAKTEIRREAAWRAESRTADFSRLPDCPFPGPQRDQFLERSAVALTRSRQLWVPVCRIVPFPDHRILIMTANRAELRDCDAGSAWRPANVFCGLEEPLGFLADARAPRTWARREAGDAIWLTSQPMAWRDHLIAAHRLWMMAALEFSVTALLLLFGVRRTRRAFVWRAACHGPGEPEVPGSAEFLLHWTLGHCCRSLPGDLTQEYAQMRENGFSRKEAGRWYRWQVFHSILSLAARRMESLPARGFGRDAFTRRS